MTTVVCVWVMANVPYTVEYVTRLEAMVAKHLDRPYRFVCLTDRPWLVPAHLESIPMVWDRTQPGWWAKVRLFDPSLKLTGRVLYLDLDTLIVDDLTPIVEYPADFALVPHAGTFNGREGRAVVKRFNSSVMTWQAGAQSALWSQWSPAVAARLWGDQDWIGEQARDAEAMPAAWFPRLSEVTTGPPFTSAIKVILAKKPKTHVAAAQWPWVDRIWRAA
jgi:hypothetical protein